MLSKTAMIMPTLMYIRKKKMFKIRTSSAILFLIIFLFSPMISAIESTKSVTLKTLKTTLETSHGILTAEIHFNEKDLSIALKVENIIKNDLIKIINYFQYVPKSVVHFNIDPYLHATNGNARVFPTPTINLFNYPPSNQEHLVVLEDWLTGLVFHEYIHITHLDQTSDYLKIGESIFGSIAKVPASIAPRWFTEGIAVWGESYLMKGGRLNNPLFKKEFAERMRDEKFCQSIDCLDDPGVFPGGQLAYWAGGHFIEYLENQKAGTVKCLVEKNSGNLPFLLNNVFRTCSDKNAQEHFSEFRKLFQNNSVQSEWGVTLADNYGISDWQKGTVLDGRSLYKVEKNRFSEALVVYDLEEKVAMLTQNYDALIADIVGITSQPDYNAEGEYNKFLIVAFYEDLNFRNDTHTWKLINAETLLIEGTLPFEHDPSYVIALGNGRYLTASYMSSHWVIEKQIIDMKTMKRIDSEVVLTLPNEENLTLFKSSGQRIFMRLYNSKSGAALYSSDLTLETLVKVHESNELFDLPLIRENLIVVQENNISNIYEFNDKTIIHSELDPAILKNLTFLETNENYYVALVDTLRVSDVPDKEYLSKLSKLSMFKKIIFPTKTIFLQEKVKDREDVAMESYPKLYHLKPHYWFIATGTNENLGSIGAMTDFTDPMGEDLISATILSYPTESLIGGSLTATHKFSSVSDLITGALNFNHEYSKTSFDSTLNQTTEFSVGFNYELQMKRWTWYPGIFTGNTKTQDFISNRNVKNYGVSSILSYSALTFDDFFKSFFIQTRLQKDLPSSGAAYSNWQNLIRAEARLSENFVLVGKISYAKLFKTGFSQGVLYGGGINELSTRRWHEFYGLPYSNAYGNKISTQRLLIDYNAWNIYRGYGLLPFYFKEFHIRAGKDFMHAERIILGNTIYRNKSIDSWFIGPRLKMNLFYHVPADIDLVYSSINHPDGRVSNQINFSLNADIF